MTRKLCTSSRARAARLPRGPVAVCALLGATVPVLATWADSPSERPAAMARAAAEAAVQPAVQPQPRPDRRPHTPRDAEWPLHGRTALEQRFSPLTGIRASNVAQLGLAWSHATGSQRGLEATPIVADGVLYATSTWSVVFALDARSGRELWRFDPQVPRAKARDACCDVVNRGVALHEGRLFFGALDGRLIALDATTGAPAWQVQTTDPTRPYTITGAPRVVGDLVVIGNGGGEFGVRGYVSAYRVGTGALAWRFYTVPASRDGPHEHPELALAAGTWSKDSMWEAGLGGTVWDSLAWDPELDLLYVGVGNSSPYDRTKRSPGGGDNLFLASILALRPATGELVWHYQTTPAENWDYTATQHMILADLELGGRVRKVLMQAPKNGFFYVLDRATGELLSADAFAPMNWASHVDLKTGRPVETGRAHWNAGQAFVLPGPTGAHNWHPMAWSPQTGLVYIPSMRMPYPFHVDPDFRFTPGSSVYNTGENFAKLAKSVDGYERSLRWCNQAELVAWDPVGRRRVWEVGFSTTVNGGVLATAGNLVFQGNGSGRFVAYRASDGRELWRSEPGIGIMAPPITYQVDGEQYIAVLAGVGGSAGMSFERAIPADNRGHVFAYKLGGKATLPVPQTRTRPKPARDSLEPLRLGAAEVERGHALYHRHCFRCHGIGTKSTGLVPDLRRSPRAVHEQWNAIVLGGTRLAGGMPSFADAIDADAAQAIEAYVIDQALREPNLLEAAADWLTERVCLSASWVTWAAD